MISFICRSRSKSKRTSTTKQKQTHRYREKTGGYQREGSGGSAQQLDFGCILDVAKNKKTGGYSSALAHDLKRNASII